MMACDLSESQHVLLCMDLFRCFSNEQAKRRLFLTYNLGSTRKPHASLQSANASPCVCLLS